MRKIIFSVVLLAFLQVLSVSCQKPRACAADDLRQKIGTIIGTHGKGTVGVAVITSSGDTVTVNDSVRYPLMSVFKMHQAIAVAHRLNELGVGYDTILHLQRSQLNPDTWSPMLNDFRQNRIGVSVGKLMSYLLIHSDNNASNVLFDHIAPVSFADSLARTVTAPDSDFQLLHTERQMQADHALSYENWSSPLACAVLIDRLFTDSILPAGMQDSVCAWLGMCQSAPNRIAASLAGHTDVALAHRTGSGYTNESGEIIAVNDVGHISFSDGTGYSIAVLVRDYPGKQEAADSLIAAISAEVFLHIGGSKGVEHP